MVSKFTKITNGLDSLGDVIDNDHKIRKVIRGLLPSWEVKATIMKVLNEKEQIELIGLIGNLKTHEIERKTREKIASQKRKMIAFKSTPTISDDDDDEEEDDK